MKLKRIHSIEATSLEIRSIAFTYVASNLGVVLTSKF